jgi:hypothetical protein
MFAASDHLAIVMHDNASHPSSAVCARVELKYVYITLLRRKCCSFSFCYSLHHINLSNAPTRARQRQATGAVTVAGAAPASARRRSRWREYTRRALSSADDSFAIRRRLAVVAGAGGTRAFDAPSPGATPRQPHLATASPLPCPSGPGGEARTRRRTRRPRRRKRRRRGVPPPPLLARPRPPPRTPRLSAIADSRTTHDNTSLLSLPPRVRACACVES